MSALLKEERFCPRCEQWLSIDEFGVNRSRKDGRNLYCKNDARELVYDFRRNHAGYKAQQSKRSRQVKQRQAQVNTEPEPAPTPIAVIDRVAQYLEEHGQATPRELHNKLKIPLREIDVALTELLITRRKIGARALSDDTRIYFWL